MKDPKDPDEREGTGALCPEAQADGVPCSTVDNDCSICGRAAPEPDEPERPDEAETG